jgi:cysteine synthase A
VVVTGIGTGGSLTGVARALKPRRPSLLIVGVEPAESAVLAGDEPGPHGIQGIGAGFRPAVLDLDMVDELMAASERDAIATARLCARVEGIPIGISSGAVLHAMLALARRPAMAGKLIVGIAASFAERYLSTDLFAGL